MKILATSDWHYPDFPERVKLIAERARELEADVLVVAGDISYDEGRMHEALGLFEDFPGKKLAVAGNHDLWVENEKGSSAKKYKRMGKVLKEHGFHYLDRGPLVLDGTGFVGNVGWYDYSLRNEGPFEDTLIVTDQGLKKWEELTNEDYAKKTVRYFRVSDIDPYASPESRTPRSTGWNDGNT